MGPAFSTALQKLQSGQARLTLTFRASASCDLHPWPIGYWRSAIVADTRVALTAGI